jgi:hypothetical protein
VRPDADIPTTELAQLCREESERYRRHRRDDGDHCFELFRRAIVDRDQQAWTGVYEQYRRLVAKWVDGSPDQVDERTNRAFEKFWLYLVTIIHDSLQNLQRQTSVTQHRGLNSLRSHRSPYRSIAFRRSSRIFSMPSLCPTV